MTLSRRNFLHTAIAGSVTLGLHAQQPESKRPAAQSRAGKRPIIISSANGYGHLEDAYALLTGGGDTLDTAVRVVKGVEDDPTQDAVGLSGLPNEEGVVELDASCMHGPTRRAGSVASVHNIKNPSLLAKAVMEKTGHVMLVAQGAERFALAQGFPRETDGLTEHARKVWLLYKETHSDWWGPGLADPNWKKRLLRQEPHAGEWQLRIDHMEQVAAGIGIAPKERMAAIRKVLFPPMGTSHCSALSESGEMSGCTTTSGLAWKIPGRVGDSPIIGAGCYTDQDVGSAGATGSGEENIKVAGAHTIIENMRHGMSPLDAGMDALKRIARNYDGDKERLQFVDMVYFVLRKDGAYAGVSLWTHREPEKPHTIAVHDGARRLENTVGLFSGAPRNWPPKLAA
jgi:N4-(beta-N-acetylglucosaminyl)-L-asparaginase